MWREQLETTIPSEGKYSNAVREYNGALYTPSPGNWNSNPQFTSRLEAMSSVNSGFRHWNNCEHFVRSVLLPSPWTLRPLTWYNTTHTRPNPGVWIPTVAATTRLWTEGLGGYIPASSFGAWDSLAKGLPVLASKNVSLEGWTMFPSLDATNRNLLLQAALAAMWPGIKTALSLPNTLFELKDMKTVSRSIKSVNDALSGLNSLMKWTKTLRGGSSLRSKGKSLRSILKGSADSYLQGSFNVLPLLSDLTALKGACGSLKDELRHLIHRAGSVQLRHFERPLTDTYEDNTEERTEVLPSNYVDTSLVYSRKVTYGTRKFNATMRYRYKLPAVSKGELALLAIMDKVGWQANPAVLWNAIPWSFVIDWFVGVSRWLNQFKMTALDPTVHVDEFCYSVNVDRRIESYLRHGQWAGLVSVVTERAYSRNVGLNQSMVTSSLKTSGLNLKEFSLSAALILSR